MTAPAALRYDLAAEALAEAVEFRARTAALTPFGTVSHPPACDLQPGDRLPTVAYTAFGVTPTTWHTVAAVHPHPLAPGALPVRVHLHGGAIAAYDPDEPITCQRGGAR